MTPQDDFDKRVQPAPIPGQQSDLPLPPPHLKPLEALAAQPDVAEKIRGGKVKAAGAIVGAVMKATRGQADARRVRELVMERVAR